MKTPTLLSALCTALLATVTVMVAAQDANSTTETILANAAAGDCIFYNVTPQSLTHDTLL
jgi:hypothetical protein